MLSNHIILLVAQTVKNLPTIQEAQVWAKIPWRREWLPTPVFLPGEFHGQRSLVGYSHGITKSQTWLTNWSESISHINDVISVFFLQLPNFIHSLKHLVFCHLGGSIPGAEIKGWMAPMRTLPSGSFWWRREHVSKFMKDARLIFTHTLTYTCTHPHSHTVVHTHTFSHTSLNTLILNL